MNQLRYFLLFLAYFGITLHVQAQSVIHAAHAHNDYLRKRPLASALEHGFTSIEVDVFPSGDQLIVAHTRLGQLRKRNFADLYLKPLIQRIEANKGRVFEQDSTILLLMIDLKANGAQSYALLTSIAEEHPELFYNFHTREWRPLQLVISGNVPRNHISHHPSPFISIDGRISDLDSPPMNLPLHRISFNYRAHFDYKGKGEISTQEQMELARLVEKANELGLELRPWNIPQREALWETLLQAGVHRISVDNYQRFSRFMRSRIQ
jgi:hypothetical protein